MTPADAVVSTRLIAQREEYVTQTGHTRYRPIVSDPSVSAWREPADRSVAQCFQNHAELDTLSFTGELRFDAVGAVQHVALPPDVLTDEEAACIETELARAVAPCPNGPDATATFHIRATFAVIGSVPE